MTGTETPIAASQVVVFKASAVMKRKLTEPSYCSSGGREVAKMTPAQSRLTKIGNHIARNIGSDLEGTVIRVTNNGLQIKWPDGKITEHRLNSPKPRQTESTCLACDGKGIMAAKQPAPGRRLYPPKCAKCDGRGRIVKAAA